jgi:hypothetical protein
VCERVAGSPPRELAARRDCASRHRPSGMEPPRRRSRIAPRCGRQEHRDRLHTVPGIRRSVATAPRRPTKPVQIPFTNVSPPFAARRRQPKSRGNSVPCAGERMPGSTQKKEERHMSKKIPVDGGGSGCGRRARRGGRGRQGDRQVRQARVGHERDPSSRPVPVHVLPVLLSQRQAGQLTPPWPGHEGHNMGGLESNLLPVQQRPSASTRDGTTTVKASTGRRFWVAGDLGDDFSRGRWSNG